MGSAIGSLNYNTIPPPASINNSMLQNNIIANNNLGLGSVSLADLQIPSVSGSVLAANSILTGHLTSNLISTANQQVGSTSGSVIAAGAILTGHLSQASVLSGNIGPNSIGSITLQSASISGNAIANQSINVAHINSNVFNANRNVIINGNMNIWQRLSGSGFTGITTPQYCVDRFSVAVNGSPVLSAYRDQGVVPANSNNSLKIQCTTATALSGSTLAYIFYGIEGYDLIPLKNKTITLSFWVNTNLPGTYAVCFRDANAAFSNVNNFTVNQANTWEKKVITITHNSAIGTYNYDNNVGMGIFFTLCAGITFQASQSNTWLAGNLIGTASGNGLGVNTGFTYGTGNVFNIAQVQLEVGDQATPFEFIPYQQDLARCQRYYEIAGTGASGYWQTGTRADLSIIFKQTKRTTTPTPALVTGTTVSIDSAAVVINVATTPTVALLYSSANSVAISCFAASYSGGGGAAGHTAISQLDSWSFNSDF